MKLAISQIVSTLIHCPLHLKNTITLQLLILKIIIIVNLSQHIRFGKYASIDHFVTDETDLKVTGQSLFFVCCLITKLFLFIL